MITDTMGRPLKDLRISVTDRCNFRCTYCMPAEIFGESYKFLPKNEILSFEEIARLARIFVEFGVNKLRITGGEPLLRTDLHKLIAMLTGMPGLEDLTLTTNAFLLPQQAQQLKDAGLQRITISLDTLDDEVFKEMNGRGISIDRVLKGIDAAAAVGLVLPELDGKLDGFAIRVPTINVSLVDLTFEAARETSVDEVHQIIRDASTSSLAGILEYNDKPLVSIDFNHNPASSIYDASMTRVVNGTTVKVCSWYDNEWGFSNRMLDTCIALMAAS